MSNRSGRHVPTAPTAIFENGQIKVDLARLKAPTATYVADWVDVRFHTTFVEILLGQTNPLTSSFNSMLVVMVSRSSWLTGLFEPVANIVTWMRSAGLKAVASEQLSETTVVNVHRICVDLLTNLTVSNGFAEMNCYRLSRYSAHQSSTNGGAVVFFPEIVIVLPAEKFLFLLEQGQINVANGAAFPGEKS